MATLASQRSLLRTDFSQSHLEAPPKHSSIKAMAMVAGGALAR